MLRSLWYALMFYSDLQPDGLIDRLMRRNTQCA